MCTFFLPLFARLDLITAYEYLEKRFDAKTRSLASLYFLLFVMVRLGALLYGASLVVSEVSDLSMPVSIAIVGVVAVIYTVAGGLAAVVWTDVLQFAMVLMGIGACIFVASREVQGGIGHIVETARVNAPGISVYSGLCILVMILAFNMLGDGVRDMIDPRLRGI